MTHYGRQYPYGRHGHGHGHRHGYGNRPAYYPGYIRETAYAYPPRPYGWNRPVVPGPYLGPGPWVEQRPWSPYY